MDTTSYWRENDLLHAWWAIHASEHPGVPAAMLEVIVYDCVYYITYYDAAVDDFIEVAEVGCDEVFKLIGKIGR